MPNLPAPFSALDAAAIAAFFQDRPDAEATFEALREEAATWGPMVLAATKSRVSFLARTRFLWVQEAHLDGTVTIGFLLPYPVESPRLRKGDLGSRWSHHVKFGALDDELRGWFRAAYEWDVSKTMP